MTDEQKQWLAEHPQHKRWRVQGAVALTGWTDVGYLCPNGHFMETGPGENRWIAPNVISYGDTLFVIPPEAIRVGREYAIC